MRRAYGETAPVRNRELHDALRDFALDAASLLTNDLAEGAELGYDVVTEPGRGPALYRYEPQTAIFIESRWDRLRGLDTFDRAARALGTGATAYLRVRGVNGVDPAPALRAMLERLYEDASELDFPEERFERVYAEVEETLYADATGVTVIAPLPGIELGGSRIELGGGLALVAGDSFDAPPEAVWPATRSRRVPARPNVLAVYDVPDSEELPLEEARDSFALLVRRLRLYKRGAVGIAPLGWARAGGGVWQPFDLSPSPHGHAEPWSLAADEAREVSDFLELCARTRPGGAVEWALDRLEIGCERDDPVEAVTDFLLGLRVLLGREGELGETLAGRVGALCGEDGERRSVERRVAAALELEQLAISGRAFSPTSRRSARSDRASSSPTSRATCARCCATSTAAISTRTSAASPTTCSSRAASRSWWKRLTCASPSP